MKKLKLTVCLIHAFGCKFRRSAVLAIVFRTFIVGALCVAGISRVSAQEKTMRVTLLEPVALRQ